MKTQFDEEYVRRVREETQKYTRDLLDENQKLRSAAAAARAEINRYAAERAAVERQLQSVEAEGRRYLEQYISVEQQNANLANLYVASFRLHSTVVEAEVVEIIKEIVINLIGSEEFAILEFDAGRSHLELIGSMGIDEERFRRIPAGRGIIGECLRSGEIFIAPDRTSSPEHTIDAITACVPLRVSDVVVGAIAIFRLLGQKNGIEDLDREMFNLLGTHAATALYCASLHSAKTALAGVAG